MERKTVEVYEALATEWRDKRPAKFLDRAEALVAAIPAGGVRADLGCGAGLHLPVLGLPAIALDAAYAMLPLARDVAPDAWCVQADLEALPLARGSLAGAWARASYLHVQPDRLPLALAQLQVALQLHAPVVITMRHGVETDQEFPGRYFSDWDAESLHAVMVGAGFDVDECALDAGGEWINVHARRAHTLPDYVGPGMRVLVCGLNPSVYAADRGAGFARPGNRFWPAALESGLATRDRDPLHALRHHGMGMTDLVKRATPRADELTAVEYHDGAARVEHLVRWLRPGAVCFVGLTGYRAAIDRRATAGEQPEPFGGVPAYVMPNTSGVNGHVSLDDLVAHLRAAAALADRSIGR
jgi:double-stranded uracil-DNA glycosylase